MNLPEMNRYFNINMNNANVYDCNLEMYPINTGVECTEQIFIAILGSAVHR